MTVQAIQEPSADARQRLVYNRYMRKGNLATIATEQKFAVVLLKLGPAITRADYPRLRTELLAIDGIDAIELLIDGQAPASIPENTRLVAAVEAQLRIEDTPPPE